MEELTREIFKQVDSDQKQPFKWVLDLIASGRILIAGCSGSGKSVALKDIIYTLMAKDPDTNQFVFVDLKRVELKVFKNAPHTLAYVTEPEQVEKALNNVLTVIDQRYRIMEQHDQLVSSEPALWVIVDEYADGTTERGKSLRECICRKFNFASLEFQTLEGVIKAIGIDPCELCTYCWNGEGDD